MSQAQGISAAPGGDACANKDYTYTYPGSTSGCSWEVKGGYTLVSGGQPGSSSITVRWNDVPTDATTNPTSVALNCGAGGTTTRAVFVSSISNVTPGPVQVNGSALGGSWALPFGENTALVLYVPLVDLPQSAQGAPPRRALTYRWVVPSGWRVQAGGGLDYVSNGTARDISQGYTTTGATSCG